MNMTGNPNSSTSEDHSDLGDSSETPAMDRDSISESALEMPKKGKRASKLIELSDAVLDLPVSERSMVWRDLPEFANKHKRTTSDIVYDLALLATHDQMLKKLTKVVLSFDLEFLVRV